MTDLIVEQRRRRIEAAKTKRARATGQFIGENDDRVLCVDVTQEWIAYLDQEKRHLERCLEVERNRPLPL